MILYRFLLWQSVSTHSRPKAAGVIKCRLRFYIVSFNTQPPEGGWHTHLFRCVLFAEFQHTAARRRLVVRPNWAVWCIRVSTHSRPKAAGWHGFAVGVCGDVSTHSRPKAAGIAPVGAHFGHVCFNTQPPEGGWESTHSQTSSIVCFNTQPPEGGWRVCQVR